MPPNDEVYRSERHRPREPGWLSRRRSPIQAQRNGPVVGEPSTPEARTRERYRRAVWATLTNVASRGLAMLLLFLGVRLTIGYLGTTRFGVWATFASMTAMLSLLDLGVGNALVNRVAHAAASDDPGAVRRIVTGGAGLLALLGAAAMGVLLVPALLLPWGELLKLSDAAAQEARQTAVAFAVLFGVNLCGSGLLRILAGQQRSHEANLIAACTAACACVALWFAASRQAGVPVLLAATFGLQALGGFVAAAILLRRQVIVVDGARAAMAVERPHLLRVGSLFVLLQLGTMLTWGGDSTILALLTGASEVAVYAVAFRLFQFASQPFAMLNAPLWAAYADARARGDTGFIRQTLKGSLLSSLFGTGLLSCILVFTGAALVSAWTQGAIVVPFELLVLFAVWTTLDAGGNAFGVYLNGTGIVREQVWVVTAFCAVALPVKLLAASQAGAIGLLIATIAAYVFVVIGLYATVFRRRALAPVTLSPT